jgi:hypothetical protein
VLAPTLIVIVEEPPEVTDVGLNETVVPDGIPLALSDTLCAEPLVTTVEIVDVPLEPGARLRLFGLAEIEKSDAAAAVTVTVTVVECVALVPVPVTVIGYVPAAVLAPTLTVIVEEPPAVTDVGLNETVIPVGMPLALSDTFCAEPLVTSVEIVDVPLEPCARLRLVGLAEIEKSDATGLVQPGNVNEPMRVCQLNAPFVAMYSFVYQNVQSSAGSTAMLV